MRAADRMLGGAPHCPGKLPMAAAAPWAVHAAPRANQWLARQPSLAHTAPGGVRTAIGVRAQRPGFPPPNLCIDPLNGRGLGMPWGGGGPSPSGEQLRIRGPAREWPQWVGECVWPPRRWV